MWVFKCVADFLELVIFLIVLAFPGKEVVCVMVLKRVCVFVIVVVWSRSLCFDATAKEVGARMENVRM